MRSFAVISILVCGRLRSFVVVCGLQADPFMVSSDRFPIPVRSAVKSNLTAYLAMLALNALTVEASTTH